MSLLASFILPHAPMLVAEIGRGREKKLPKTLEAYKKVASEIASLKPDIIVIASPHAESYSDYFQMADGEMATGSLAEYGAPQLRFRLRYNDELRKEIARISFARGLKAGYSDSSETSLDHGTMVPLYFINQAYQNYEVVRIGLTGLSYFEHYEMGMVIGEAAKRSDKRIIFIASGDMSHCLNKEGEYGCNEEAKHYEELLNKCLYKANFGDLLRMDKTMVKDAKECGHRAFAMLSGTLDRCSVDPIFFAHEDTLGTGHGIYEYKVTGNDDSRAFGDFYLSKVAFSIKAKKENADDYLRLAYLAAEQFILKGKGEKMEVPSSFSAKGKGVIVSVSEFGTLRGRNVFLPKADSSLASSLIDSTISAIKDDSRFDPLSEKDLPYLDIEVTEMFSFASIKDMKDFDASKYALLVSADSRCGLSFPPSSSASIALNKAKKDAMMEEADNCTLYSFLPLSHK